MESGLFEIRQLPLSLPLIRKKVERFLSENGLRLDPVDYYAGIFQPEGDEMLAGGGLSGDVIKCVAVSNKMRDAQLSLTLFSHLISVASANGCKSVKCFTKPENKQKFESLGFKLLAQAPEAILMENGNGLANYCKYLSEKRRNGASGAIVMNANPFTLGHRWLIEQAAKQVDNLYVIVVREDVSLFKYAERKAMIEAGCADITNVTVCEGSSYAVSALSFPTYFLKKIDTATDTQITLDLDLFARHIAPALNISARFVGSEPTDALTNRYNELMKVLLPQNGIDVKETERLQKDGIVVSASALRKALSEGSFSRAAAMACRESLPYILSMLATEALKDELDTTPKPGLVDKNDNGAHTDMNHSLMMRSIETLCPFFTRLSLLGWKESKPDINEIRLIGIEAEKAMLDATHGVNTHKGALFSMGLMLVSAANTLQQKGEIRSERLQECVIRLAQQMPRPNGTHGSEAKKRFGIRGALDIACEGYEELFHNWLPYLRQHFTDQYAMHRTLLFIMTSLDDTNIYHRKGADAAAEVKLWAQEVLNDFSVDRLNTLNVKMISQNLSPGGAADMLALTKFVCVITG